MGKGKRVWGDEREDGEMGKGWVEGKGSGEGEEREE